MDKWEQSANAGKGANDKRVNKRLEYGSGVENNASTRGGER